MAERIQKQKPAPQERKAEASATPAPRSEEAQEKLDSSADLLDEIDNLLDDVLGEQSAEEFVAGYRQKGGQ